MDVNKIFNLFNEGEQLNTNEYLNGLDDNSPYYKIIIFKKLIMNGGVFRKGVLKFFSKMDTELDLEDIDNAGEFMMYCRAWFWAKQFDLEDTTWIQMIEKLSDQELLTAVKLTIHYFEEIQEFEKCAFLKKIQDLVQNSLAVE